MLKEKSKEPVCPVYKKCGGCQLQNLSYDRQLQFKQVKAIKLLGKFCHVNEIFGMNEPYHYRNKVQAAFGYDRRKNLVCGVYQSSTHKIVENKGCLTEDKRADEIIAVIKKLVKSFGLKPFDETTMTGYIRHVLIKRAFKTGEIMVVLVVGYEDFPKKRSFINAILKHCPDVTTIVENINTSFGSMVLSDKTNVLYGPGKIEEELMGKRFRISPEAFYQINPVMTEVLYKKALQFLDLKGTETVIDAYCGTGTIGILAADKAKRVLGVELNKDAVSDAKENAKLNNTENIEFICADAGEYMEALAEEKYPIDAVMMDPPRKGSSKKFLNSLCLLSPKKIVYISCNPETQARDLEFLTKRGYIVKKIQPVDMFPHTNHIESIVCLTRRLDNELRKRTN